MNQILNYLFNQKILNKAESKSIILDIEYEKFHELEIAAFISIYNMRPIYIEEIEGFKEALLELCIKLDFNDFEFLDIVGTGGDDKLTFNISTLASFIVASTGEKVVKHGNYSFSSITGSSTILKSLGCKFSNDETHLKRQLEKTGICFIHGPKFNTILKKISNIRKLLGIRTFFNLLGPLINPCTPKNIFIGVNSLELARTYNYIYQNSNKNYIIIHSLDGYDEISLTSQFKCYSNKEEIIFSPQELGLEILNPHNIKGGQNHEENKNIFLKIITGSGTKSQNYVVFTNAAFGLGLLNKKSFEHNYQLAKENLESKRAKKTLEKFISFQYE